MASKHSLTKRRRRPKNKNRRDYTRSTMLSLRSPERRALAALHAEELRKNEEEK